MQPYVYPSLIQVKVQFSHATSQSQDSSSNTLEVVGCSCDGVFLIGDGEEVTICGQVTSNPALSDLDGCIANFSYPAAGTQESFNLPEDCTVTSLGDGEFLIECLTSEIGSGGVYTLEVDCTAKDYGTDVSTECAV